MTEAQVYPLLPLPTRAVLQDKRVLLPRAVRCEGPDAARVERAARRLVAASTGAAERTISVRWEHASATPQSDENERYTLVADGSGVVIEAQSIWGALHGLTTLAQLVSPAGICLCNIEDGPRFAWRGLMLDPARRFLPIPVLERVIDGMAHLKMNVLHLHLSDDQGFVFQSRLFPKLAGPEHYTQAELGALVGYAADRGVRLVPELDMPGHVTSWLAAYPEWGAGKTETTQRFGVHPACLNPADESVYAAIDGLLAEVTEVFPDEYVHIGGDEVHPGWWREHAGVQAFMAEQGLPDVAALQAYFNRRVADSLASRGRKVIGWDEVLHQNMPDKLLVQSWRGATARDRALDAGHDCVVSEGYYLDLFYPGDVHGKFDPTASQAELVRLEDALLTDPRFEHVAAGMRWTHAWRALPSIIPATTSSDPNRSSPSRGKVIGGEACLWGELVDRDCLPGRLWSRLPAIAERLWSAHPETDDPIKLRTRYPDFVRSELVHQQRRLAAIMANDPALEVIQLCEPVKWYARLLGEVALEARIRGSEMPQARPYTKQSRLDRAVDYLLPESLPALTMQKLPVNELASACQRWCAIAGSNDAPEDVLPVLRAIGRGAAVMLDFLAGGLSREEARRRLLELHRPYGEYMPAVLLVLADRLE